MKDVAYLLFISILFCRCSSPSQYLEEQRCDRAFTSALSAIKKNKEPDVNGYVLEQAAAQLSQQAQNFVKIKRNSNDVEDWIDARTESFELLEALGRANMLMNGSLSESYDPLCDLKHEVDYQIADYYYTKGEDFLDMHDQEGRKTDAQAAYYEFMECADNGGDDFFPQLVEDRDEAYDKGVVYYRANESVGSSLFFKRLARKSKAKPDCQIRVEYGWVSHSESVSTDKDDFAKEVENGTESMTDTAGHVTVTQLYKTVTAQVTTKTITVSSTMTTWIYVDDISGQCPVSTRSYDTTLSDTYEEISVTGDRAALNRTIIESSGRPSGFQSSLDRKVLRKASSDATI